MNLIKSLFSALSMYSRIPCPQVEWKEENRRYSLCFFSLIGVVIGAILVLWRVASEKLGIGNLLFASVAVVIPIIITGGIHLDGFCDVSDALACCGSREKMLSVMSDSSVGAFAVIKLCCYLLIQLGLFSQIASTEIMVICALGFVMSRGFSGLAAVTFKNAKGDGALQSFSEPAHRRATISVELVVILLVSAVMVYTNAVAGAFAVLGGFAAFIFYRLFSYKKFGGITGDLAGYFLQICELCIMAFAVTASLILEVL